MERALLQMLSTHRDVALMVCDRRGEITMRTPALDRMLKGVALPSVKRPAIERLALLDAEGRAISFEELPLTRAWRGQTVTDELLALDRPDGRRVYLRCNAVPLSEEEGQSEGAVLLVQDVTREWSTLLKQQELRDRLVTTVSHELRTPLTTVIGHAELLGDAVEDGELPAHLARSVAAISRACRDLAAMADRLNHLAELDQATQVRLARCDLAAVLRAAVDDHRPAATARRVRLELRGPSALRRTLDESLVRKAIDELLDNALVHAPVESTVVVGLAAVGGQAEVSVADEGPGIPEEERARILQPFERGDLPSGAVSSTGLGLAVVGAVAAAHGGALALEDNDPRGLVVKVCLPGRGA